MTTVTQMASKMWQKKKQNTGAQVKQNEQFIVPSTDYKLSSVRYTLWGDKVKPVQVQTTLPWWMSRQAPHSMRKRLFYKLHLSFKGTALEPTRKGCLVTTGVQTLQCRDPNHT